MGTGTDHRTLVDLAYIVWTFDGSQPSHRSIIARSFTAWVSTLGSTTGRGRYDLADRKQSPIPLEDEQ